MKKLLNEKYFTLFTFLAAFLIRLYQINLQDLWRDEAFSVNASMSPISQILHIAANDTQPPLHMLILHLWGKFFGFSEFSMRFVSLIFGMIALYFIYLIAKRIFSDTRLVFLSISIAAFSPLLIHYSQEARAYSMLLAFFSISFYFFLKIISKDFKTIDLRLFIAVCLLGLYTQNIFVVVIASYGMIWLGCSLKRYKFEIKNYLKSPDFKILLVTFVSIGILYLPWFLAFIKQYSKITTEGFWLVFLPIEDVLDSLGYFFIGHTYNWDFGLIDGVLAWIIFLIGLFTFCVGLWSELREIDPKVKRENKVYISLYLFIILSLIWLISFKTPFFYIRYIMFAAPLIFFLSVRGFRVFLRIKKLEKFVLSLATIFVISLAGFQVINNANNVLNPKFNEAIEIINNSLLPNRDLIIVPNALAFHSADYYITLRKANFRVQIYNPENDLAYYEGLSSLDENDFYTGMLYHYDRIWLMQLEDSNVPDHLVISGFEKQSDYNPKGIQMSLWTKVYVRESQ